MNNPLPKSPTRNTIETLAYVPGIITKSRKFASPNSWQVFCLVYKIAYLLPKTLKAGWRNAQSAIPSAGQPNSRWSLGQRRIRSPPEKEHDHVKCKELETDWETNHVANDVRTLRIESDCRRQHQQGNLQTQWQTDYQGRLAFLIHGTLLVQVAHHHDARTGIYPKQ